MGILEPVNYLIHVDIFAQGAIIAGVHIVLAYSDVGKMSGITITIQMKRLGMKRTKELDQWVQ